MSLRDLLPGIFSDVRRVRRDIPKEHMDKILEAVSTRIESEPPPRVAFIGEVGVGKSSTLNALFNAGQAVSHVRAQTQEAVQLEVMQGALVVYDMPGLGESRAKRQQHRAIYENVLPQVDVALWILDAQFKAIEYVQQYLEDELSTLNPSLIKRMVFALNKVDLVHPGETSWITSVNLPSQEQERNIRERVSDVNKHVREVLPSWRGSVIGYSATKRYFLPELFKEALDAVDEERQWVVSSRRALADFLELVDQDMLPEERRISSSKKPPNVQHDERDAFSQLASLSREELEAAPKEPSELAAWLKRRFGYTQRGGSR